MGEEPDLPPPPEWQKRFDEGNLFEARVFEAFRAALGPRCLDLSEMAKADPGKNVLVAATVDAMTRGVEVILGGGLPDDVAGGRSGKPDVLVRASDGGGYRAADVKWHKAVAAHDVKKPGSVDVSWIDDPARERAVVEVGWTLVTRVEDWLQLAHYHRMLEAMDCAAPGPATGGLIGTGEVDGRSHPIAWIDLAEPRIATFSRSSATGRTKRSVLESYDHEFSFRRQVAERALVRREDPTLPALVEPILQEECECCVWRQACPLLLSDDDATRHLPPAPADAKREWALLHAAGVRSLGDVAAVELEGPTVQSVLEQVGDRGKVRNRIAGYRRKAAMIQRGARIERIGREPLDLPVRDVEVDFDIEWDPDGRIYLYGFLISRAGLAPAYHDVSSFEQLTDETNAELARRAVARLVCERDGAVANRLSFAVFHYSGPERSGVRKALPEGDRPAFDQLVHDCFIDLCDVVRANFFGLWGLGLKEAAPHLAGFHWRDEDPGGLSSQDWAAEAFDGDEAARQRVLRYNEDDVRATLALRRWLRAQA